MKPVNWKHGGKGTRLYKTWISIKGRCNNENYSEYQHYGGRCIYVVPEWYDFVNFRDWAMTNGYDNSLQIDRIDNNGPYSPDNCRFVDCKTNNRNRSDTIKLTIFGETKPLVEWIEDPRCPKYLSREAFKRRLDRGWTISDAFTRKVKLYGTRT